MVLKREIDSEYKPLTNVKLRFNFDPHSVETQEEYRDVKYELKQGLLGIFVKGEKNIFVQERVSENKSEMDEDDRLHNDSFKKYKSFLMALIYSDFVKEYQKNPTHQELNEHLEKIRKIVTPETAPKFSYHLLTAEVLDEFLAEGYEIEEVLEKTTLPSRARYIDDNGGFKDNTFSTFKNSIMWVHNTSKLRNISIIKQVNEIAQSAEENNEKTNIYVRLGTNHAILLNLLPVRLQSVITESNIVPLFTPNKNVDLLFEMLRADIPVDNETWRLAYEEIRTNKLKTNLLAIDDMAK